jgi:hypothetical protein
LVQPTTHGSVAPPPPILPDAADSERGYAAWLPPGLDNPRRPADPFGLTTYPR